MRSKSLTFILPLLLLISQTHSFSVNFLAREPTLTEQEYINRISLGSTSQEATTTEIPLQGVAGYLYEARISVGTPENQFTVVIDTANANTWITGYNCSSIACANRKKYDPSKSSTSTVNGTDAKFTFLFGQGLTQGVVVDDHVAVGEITDTEAQFVMAYALDAFFIPTPYLFDGALGLGLGGAVDGVPTIMEDLNRLGLIEDNSFSIFLNDKIGKLEIGGVDTSLNASKFAYYPLNSDTQWSISVENIQLGNQKYLVSAMSAVIDAKFPGLAGPWDIVNNILSYFTKPLDCTYIAQYPVLKIQVGQDFYYIHPSQYMSNSLGRCIISGIIPVSGLDHFVFGNLFMRNYYTHFSAGDKQIGFARPNVIRS